MTNFLSELHGFVWGIPALLMILGVGLFLSVRLRFAQLFLLPEALRDFFRMLRGKGEVQDGVSPFQALCTALAATVGTGNLVGVAGAICLGGPGAIFWMWLSALLGMATKYAEVTLALRYRKETPDGFIGGPMYVMTLGLGERFRPLAKLYCVFGVIAAFGVGSAAQVNAAITGMNGMLHTFGVEPSIQGNLLMGIALGALMCVLILGGARRIGQAAQMLVPVGAAVYILLCFGVLIVRARYIPQAFQSIFEGAFSPRGITGGMIGSAYQALRIGCSRGVFTNEAGMGTASIAHASAKVDHPAQQGLMGIMEVFIDTVVICTLTALVILVSGIAIPFGADLGAELTERAFSAVYGGFARVLLALMLTVFAVATVLGWGLYGARCSEFLFGRNAWKWFSIAQGISAALSAVLDTGTVWQFSETINGLMALPNLIAIATLSPQVACMTKEYKNSHRRSGAQSVGGGNYANIHQCESL